MPETTLDQLTALTALDGRYRAKIQDLATFFSESALIKIRVEIEAKYLIALSEAGVTRKLSSEEKNYLTSLPSQISLKEAHEVKNLEQETRHDVKAMERFLRKALEQTSLSDLVEMIHFGLTSSDINNIATNLQLVRASQEIMIPALEQIINKLSEMANETKDVAMLARTHGQAAVPTTLGKEIAVFVSRLNKQIGKLRNAKLTGKLNGAVGNYNALQTAQPDIDWIKFSEDFIKSLGLEPNLITTQINNYDDVAEYMQIYQRVNNVITSLDQDIWRYISDHWFVQEAKEEEVGSSTMPQKVNPIDFENSEGNLGLANALFEHMARKLPISRLQRDLSDTTVARNYGTAFGYCLVAYESTLTGLSRIKPNLEQIEKDLNADWSILSEAVQTILRKSGVSDPYSMVKDLVRGKKLTEEDYKKFVNELEIDEKIKDELLKLTLSSYTGLAKELTEKAIQGLK
ncbi:MAG: adenylosuccinate lyase [Candidatus Levybacteria bacterium RIFCSPHIGHO2_01_FULL_40_10]|nr:MAG: adenylosuccinate lyase [Candidatus Levybacteria bacterium RIFCSPHIGHO2_01_FULL_40_10]